MRWIIVLAALELYVGSAELCYLSSENPYSWVISLSKIKTKLTVCVGTLIAKNYVTAPMTCFHERPGGGFVKGSDFLAISSDSCRQSRRGKLVMGHPQTAHDKFTHNIAYLEVEPFDVDPVRPPVMPLPKSEKFNVKFLATLMSEKAKCQFLWFHKAHNEDDQKRQLAASDVTMITRPQCWDTYCPSGNRGCVSYFWASETYVCSIYNDPGNQESACSHVSIGAPLICNGTAVGVLKTCYRDRPLMTQGYNKHQLKGIRLYQEIAAGKEEVEPDGAEQEEPEFPQNEREVEFETFWRRS